MGTHTTANASKYQILNVTIVSVLNWEELDQRRIEEEENPKSEPARIIYTVHVWVCNQKKKKKKPTDRPYLKTPSARKTFFFFSSPYTNYKRIIMIWSKFFWGFVLLETCIAAGVASGVAKERKGKEKEREKGKKEKQKHKREKIKKTQPRNQFVISCLIIIMKVPLK